MHGLGSEAAILDRVLSGSRIGCLRGMAVESIIVSAYAGRSILSGAAQNDAQPLAEGARYRSDGFRGGARWTPTGACARIIPRPRPRRRRCTERSRGLIRFSSCVPSGQQDPVKVLASPFPSLVRVAAACAAASASGLAQLLACGPPDQPGPGWHDGRVLCGVAGRPFGKICFGLIGRALARRPMSGLRVRTMLVTRTTGMRRVRARLRAARRPTRFPQARDPRTVPAGRLRGASGAVFLGASARVRAARGMGPGRVCLA